MVDLPRFGSGWRCIAHFDPRDEGFSVIRVEHHAAHPELRVVPRFFAVLTQSRLTHAKLRGHFFRGTKHWLTWWLYLFRSRCQHSLRRTGPTRFVILQLTEQGVSTSGFSGQGFQPLCELLGKDDWLVLA